MKKDAKSIYAQSSDIKSRTYLEYRRDMKKKAIAELEVLDWLENKIKELYPGKSVSVMKSGGDKFLWFLRKGGVTREPDFIAEIDDEEIEFEFQYAEKANLPFFDFKVSKVAKKKGDKRKVIEDKMFIYIHKPSYRYAIIEPQWIMDNSEYGMVPAWRSYAFRVPKADFEQILEDDNNLKILIKIIDLKNYILNFQYELINLNKERFSHLLQNVVDENKIIKIIPKDLDSFFRICFILDNMNKVPENANLWLIYVLSYIRKENTLNEISKIIFCIDFLYSKIELESNELNMIISKIKELKKLINNCYKDDGSYISTIKESPLEETRYALFSLNLLEDLIQDLQYYYPVTEFNPINKIFENVDDVEKTYKLIKSAT